MLVLGSPHPLTPSGQYRRSKIGHNSSLKSSLHAHISLPLQYNQRTSIDHLSSLISHQISLALS